MPYQQAPAESQLEQTIEELKKAERIQKALFHISDLAGANLDTDDILQRLHQIIAELMYAENFYIFLYSADQDTVRFRYFVDVATEPPDLSANIPLEAIKHSLTWYVIRLGKALRGSISDIEKMVPGPLKSLGATASDWLGVPMLDGNQVRGILVLQSYNQENRYSQEEQHLLSFVASHILTMLQRRQAHKDLEEAVVSRTRELAEANRALQVEVVQRRRSERLQKALFHIAEQASEAGREKDFFELVHREVGQLIYAENFFIALLVDQDQALEFAYYADESQGTHEKRRLGGGLTEYALGQDQGVLLTQADMLELIEANAVDPKGQGALPLAWMGVPLQCEGKTLGLLAVQSYREDRVYQKEDLDLLRFVSNQLASSLERKRALTSLREAKETLEQRVLERTQELSKANEALAEQSLTDPLTGLRNRRYLVEQAPADVALVDRYYRDQNAAPGEQLGENVDLLFLMLDIDHFKQINDQYGHSAGDRVLEQVRDILNQSIRESDTAVRWGGEEFLIMARFTDACFAPRLAERLRRSMAEYEFDLGRDLTVRLTCSLGYAQYPIFPARPGHVHWEEVINVADQCLYAAKRTWRDAWVGVRWAELPPPRSLPKRLTRVLPELIESGHLEVATSGPDGTRIEWPD